MSNLYTELTPNHIYTHNGEPKNISISNRIVFELRNLSADTAIAISNPEAKEYPSLPSYEEVDTQPADGLSCLYLNFPIGTGDDCFTDADSFLEITIGQPENWHCQRQGADTFIFYPTKTFSLAPGSSVEFVLDHIVTNIPCNTLSVCRIKYVNMESAPITETHAVIYKKRCPLGIRSFAPDLKDIITGFRDIVTLSWLVAGADRVLLNPGDSQQDKEGSCEVSVYQKTCYTLTAYCGHQQISQSIFLEPLTASIKSLTCQTDKTAGTVTFFYEVANTRHAFFTQKGRLPINASGKGSFTIPLPEKQTSYTLTVENEDGLVSQSITVGI